MTIETRTLAFIYDLKVPENIFEDEKVAESRRSQDAWITLKISLVILSQFIYRTACTCVRKTLLKKLRCPYFYVRFLSVYDTLVVCTLCEPQPLEKMEWKIVYVVFGFMFDF